MNRFIPALALAFAAKSSLAQTLPPDCPDDGRLKGVRIGSELFKTTVFNLAKHACVTRGPNGTFLVTVRGVQRIEEPQGK